MSENIIEILEKESVSEYDGKTYIDAEVSIKQLTGYGLLVFKEPVKVTISVEKGAEIAYFYYGFGMEDKASVTKEKNCLYNYTGNNEECNPIKTAVASIAYDLNHAFFHYDGDPNFGHRHWALRAILKDNVEKALEWYELEDVKSDSKIV